MNIPLLVTKLHIPEPPVKLVVRPQLLAQLNAGLSRRLSLISAQAGFGKTSLAGQWVRQCGLPTAWVSLDEGENDPVRFWSYVIAAIQTVYPSVGSGFLTAMTAPQSPPVEILLTGLINELAGVEQRFVLVLDDYHLIRVQAIHEAVTYLIEHAPDTVHWVIATRADPPLPLARLRARQQMTEIRAAQLRFSLDESQELFNRLMGLVLSAEETAALVGRTEGWAAGLQLAGISLQNRPDKQSFIEAFTGSHQFVLDYLMDEVLQRQPGDVQIFLLCTSVLDSLNSEVAAYLLADPAVPEREVLAGTGFSQEMLGRLVQENLFIVALDEKRCWYRYHHLFADLLRSQLARLYPALPEKLYRRASRWYESQGDPRAAMKHAHAAGDTERMADLTEAFSFGLLIQGEITTILDWIASLPEDAFGGRPWLYIYHAWALMLTRRPREAMQELRKGEAWIPKDGSGEEYAYMRAHIAAIRAFLAFMGKEIAEILPYAKQARQFLPADEQAISSILGFLEGGVLITEWRTEEAFNVFLQAGDQGYRSGNIHIAVPATCSAGGICEMQGKLRQAEQLYRLGFQRAEAHGGRNSPLLARAYSGLSGLVYERNQLDQAAEYAREGIRLEKMWGNLDSQVKNSLVLAKAMAACGEKGEALSIAEEAMQIVRTAPLTPGMAEYAWLYQTQIWFMLDMKEHLQQWLQNGTVPLGGGISYVNEPVWFARALSLTALDKGEEAVDLASRLLTNAKQIGWLGRVVSYAALKGRLLWMTGEEEQALAVLQPALAIGEPEGFVRSFLDLGPEMVPLLRSCHRRGVYAEYAGKLARRFPDGEADFEEGLLSPREMEVLTLLAEGRSNHEIAAELVVALSTVKRHIHHIYGKLEVHSRTQAIARGRELGLV